MLENFKKNVKVENSVKNPMKQNLYKRQTESFKYKVCDSTISAHGITAGLQARKKSIPSRYSESSSQAKSSKDDKILEVVDMNKTMIDPDQSFLTDTAKGLGLMLDSKPPGTVDIIGDNVNTDEDKEDENVNLDHQMELFQKWLELVKDEEKETLVPSEKRSC